MSMNLKSLVRLSIKACVLACFSFSVLAANVPSQISPQQIEQFKRLPESQQRALARSMGIDFNQLKSQLTQSSNELNPELSPSYKVYPRGTTFNEYGEPIDDENNSEQQTIEDRLSDEPEPFGYDVFANAPSTFAPMMDIAIPDSYILGSGDTLNIQMFGKQNLDYQTKVSREGNIVIPELGKFSISGLTFLEAKKVLSAQVKERILGVEIAVNLVELRSMRVFVLGEAFKPGPYILSSLSSITHAIFAAGGTSDIGSLRAIQLKRNGKLITTLDLYDLLINGDSSNDLRLESGDVVFIPPVGDRATINGEVRRPAIYELISGDTFENVVNMAGGLLPSAYPSSTVVERFNKQNLRTVKNIDLSDAKYLNQLVKPGDHINVLPTSEQYEMSVSVIGAVSRPGKYQWHTGQKVSDLLPNVHSYLLDNADLYYSLVVREKGLSRNIEVLQFNIIEALSDKNSAQNIVLQPRDKILIFSNNEKNDALDSSLDKLAYTSNELMDREKKLALEKYKNELFWQEYGDESKEYQSLDEADAALELASKSLEELTGGNQSVKEVAVRDLALFSRKRLLAPVILKLQNQAASGLPIELVEVVGSVKYPGIYPLATGMKVIRAVEAAGGLLESAYLDKSEVTRNELSHGVALKKSINFSLRKAIAGDSDNLVLQSKDRLNIHQIPAWQENHIVELRGEFKFPGKYTISRGETLAQLIERAGGYTDYAYLEASVFTREKLKQLELQSLLRVSESLRMEIASKSLAQSKNSQMVDYSQAKLLLADLTKVKPVGRLVVDLPDINSGTEQDILLENGDILYVPTKQNSVNVIGQVQVATSHMYQSDLTAFDYVGLSGGIKQQADEARIYVIKANGAVEIPSNGGDWFSSKIENELKPGDTVVVPLDSDYMDNLTLWATGTQIIYQAAVAIAAVAGI